MLKKKISQLADDTSIILDGSRESLLETVKTLKKFSELSGLSINSSKTHAVWIGAKRFSQDIIHSDLNFSCGNSRFTLLGIHFDVYLQKIPKINYEPKLIQIKAIISQWRKQK